MNMNVLFKFFIIWTFIFNLSFAKNEKNEIKIGVAGESNYNIINLGIVPQMTKLGYKIKLIEFNDYIQPNLALDNGSLDANLFQHEIYLNQFNKDRSSDLIALVKAPIAPMGLYSKKYKQFNEIKYKSKIATPMDTTTLARALILLERLNLIKLKSEINLLFANQFDIIDNPLNLQIIAIDSPQVPRALDDVDFAFITGNFAASAGLKLKDAIYLESVADHYLNLLAIKKQNKNDKWTKDLEQSFKSDYFKNVVNKYFTNYAKPDFLK